ncbi:MAG: hypothetical protein PHT62_02625 [Desulfotomaculaceae bacterium]|nr:hypothetical protein [Desulfotomaculaceae bacterium]
MACSNLFEIIQALKNNMAAQIGWLKGCQILSPGSSADGAIGRYPDQGWVMPYFANFAAMALLEDVNAHHLVERYLNWYLANLEDDGSIKDYHYDENLNAKKALPDSEDAYAGTYLSLVATYHEHTQHTNWVIKNLPSLKKVANCIVNLTDRDGLTFALAKYRVKYLMDNCEVYRGLADFARLLDFLGDQEASFFDARAKALATGIEKALWDSRQSCYHPSKTGWWLRPGVNLKKFYPDATCQIFPVLYGLIEPGSDRGTNLYELFNSNHPDWLTIKPPDYPWVILGYYASLHGDYKRAYEKLHYVREEYIATKSGNWFCAEAAFFVLTCARLLQRSGAWLFTRS